MALALAWFPDDEWARALDRWPDLAELAVDRPAYSHRIEARLKWLVKQMPGHALHVSPLTVDELIVAAGDEAGTGAARSELAAQVLR